MMESESPPPHSLVVRLNHTLKRRTFRSLVHRNYRLYFFGQLVSFIGSWVQTTAMMWLAYDLTNDPGWPAYLLVAQVGPTLLLGPLGGSLADRYSKRTLILATQLAFMLNAALLAFLVGLGWATPALLLAAQAASGIIQGIDLPTRLAVVTDLVPREDVVNAVGLNSLLFNSARAVGPALAGVIFLTASRFDGFGLPAHAGAFACFALNAVSYLAVLRALARIELPRSTVKETSGGSFWEGFRYLASRRELLALVGLTGLFCVFAWPILTLLPPYTRLVLGRAEGTYSVLLSAFGGGALVGALTTATFGSIRRRGPYLLLGAAVGAAGLLLLQSVAEFVPAFAACLLLGFGMVLYLSTGQSTMQTSVPNAVRGRTMAIWAMMLSASSLPGHLLAGLLARHYPITDVLAVMFIGVAAAMFGLTVLVFRRSLEIRPVEPDHRKI
jgi:MFS family permease